ncbi:unnamed protein product [Cyprideis torosa]|uniref:Uncharacterized protein n=1 Tax=Cyprideis torosa TaxID=163714 RepID=A0A7R8ZJ02_9CRUS|nr:unnamed protein product [Cyprideis torosa]CAG0881214.1 unnamed protein product [Cyprideis torosa]
MRRRRKHTLKAGNSEAEANVATSPSLSTSRGVSELPVVVNTLCRQAQHHNRTIEILTTALFLERHQNIHTTPPLLRQLAAYFTQPNDSCSPLPFTWLADYPLLLNYWKELPSLPLSDGATETLEDESCKRHDFGDNVEIYHLKKAEVLAIICDNATNMTKAVKLLNEEVEDEEPSDSDENFNLDVDRAQHQRVEKDVFDDDNPCIKILAPFDLNDFVVHHIRWVSCANVVRRGLIHGHETPVCGVCVGVLSKDGPYVLYLISVEARKDFVCEAIKQCPRNKLLVVRSQVRSMEGSKSSSGELSEDQALKKEFLSHIDNATSQFLSHHKLQLRRKDINGSISGAAVNDLQKQNLETNRQKRGPVQKTFRIRPSYFTTLMEESGHARAIHHILFVLILFHMTGHILANYSDNGTMGLGMIHWNFQGLENVFYVWTYMQLSACVAYFIFRFWAKNIAEAGPRFNQIFLAMYVLGAILFIYYPAKYIWEFHPTPTCSAIIVAEQTRLSMKIHAFVRTNITRTLEYWVSKSKGRRPSSTESVIYSTQPSEDGPCPKFSRFIYFLFAPTLLYRDEYPRNSKIRWSWVFYFLSEVIICVIVQFLFFHLLLPPIQNLANKERITMVDMFTACMNNALTAVVMQITGWFCIIHAWSNLFAELLRFGDRLFYTDWWTSASHHQYYRTWNKIVHEWLYEYIYTDLALLAGSKNKILPAAGVFLVSALVHEYILVLICRFAFPLLFFVFFGTAICMLRIEQSNLSMVFTLAIGNAFIYTLYTLEFYSRQKCSTESRRTNRSWKKLHLRRLKQTAKNQYHKVAKRNQSHKVAKRNQSHQVAKRNQSHQVAKRNQSHQLAKRNQSHQLAKRSQSHQVAKRSQSHQVAKRSQSHQVAKRSQSHQVAKRNRFRNQQHRRASKEVKRKTQERVK